MWKHIALRADRYVNAVVALRRALNQWYRLDNSLMEMPREGEAARTASEALVIQQGALFRALEMLQGMSTRADGK
jgi:hypothetical protein